MKLVGQIGIPRQAGSLSYIVLRRVERSLKSTLAERDTAACKSSTNYVYDFGGKNLQLLH